MTNSQPLVQPEQHVSPHVRLTPEQVRQLWDLGHLKVSGYIYLLLSSQKQHGWEHRITNINDFCDVWGIDRRSFYRAKALLITQGLLSEKIPGEIILRTSTKSSTVIGIGDTAPAVTEMSPAVTEMSPAVTEMSPAVTEMSPAVTEMSQRPTSNATPESISDPPQLFIRSISTLRSDLLHKEEEPKKINSGGEDFDQEPIHPPINSQSEKIETRSVKREKVKLSRADLQNFIEFFNQNKPDCWGRVTTLTPKRERSLNAFVAIHQDRSAEVFQEALAYARSDKWASTHDLTFDNFMTNDKPTYWAEKYHARGGSNAPQSDDDRRKAMIYAAAANAQREMEMTA